MVDYIILRPSKTNPLAQMKKVHHKHYTSLATIYIYI